jgi:hypothetical protein
MFSLLFADSMLSLYVHMCCTYMGMWMVVEAFAVLFPYQQTGLGNYFLRAVHSLKITVYTYTKLGKFSPIG